MKRWAIEGEVSFSPGQVSFNESKSNLWNLSYTYLQELQNPADKVVFPFQRHLSGEDVSFVLEHEELGGCAHQ